jgi:AraC-like DNA-binding protein
MESSFLFQSGTYKLERLDYFEQGRPPVSPAFFVFIGIIMTYIAVYLAISFVKLINHQKNIKLFAASVETINLQWLQFFLYGVLFMFVIWISGGLFRLEFFMTYEYIGYFIIIYFLGYHAIRQPAIFPFTEQEKQEISDMIEAETQPVIADKRKMFSESAFDELKTRLSNLMEAEKPYLDNELKLPKLAKMMRLSTHEMSYLLNEGFQENFFQFVNRYRIEESKRLLANPEMIALHSMVGIAFEAGFNSKTTFNTAFKKATGFSPSEFQKMSLEKELA